MIPQDKSSAVTNALHRAFGVSEPDAIQSLPAGVSSDLLFRITIAGEAFLLLVMPRIDEINDPTRRFACMKIAADAGIAPEIRYMDLEEGISITRIVDNRPCSIDDARIKVPQIIALLHTLASFPKEFNYSTADKSIQRFRTLELLPKSRVDRVFAHYSKIARRYPRFDCDMVSSHGESTARHYPFRRHPYLACRLESRIRQRSLLRSCRGGELLGF